MVMQAGGQASQSLPPHFGITPRHVVQVHGTRRAAANLKHFPPDLEMTAHAFMPSESPPDA